MSNKANKESFRDTIGTVDAEGKRKWVFPKQPDGRYYRWRSYVSYVLLVVLFGLPWIKIGGEPLILLNVLERRFILFGLSFTPQDFHLFAILMITGVVFIALFTVVFGRLFCGWFCPQTIFMEMVFRKIEYWIEGDGNAQRRLDKAPWDKDKIRKKVTKQALFLLISVVIAHHCCLHRGILLRFRQYAGAGLHRHLSLRSPAGCLARQRQHQRYLRLRTGRTPRQNPQGPAKEKQL
jgi:hypothetical protein